MLPSMHGRWSEDAVGGTSANRGSVFAPSEIRPMVPRPQGNLPMLPSRNLSAGGGGQPMAMGGVGMPQANSPVVRGRGF